MTDREWRDRIFVSLDKIELKTEKIEAKVENINNEMTTLKVKVALFSSIISSIATLVAERLFK